MRHAAVIFVFIFFVVSGVGSSGWAQDAVQTRINMVKDVVTTNETYGVSFTLAGDLLKKVTRVLIDGPKGRRIWLNNTLDLNEIFLSSANLSLEDFNYWFPEGQYMIKLFPTVYGILKIQMTHNFPPVPGISYPADGATDVPVNAVFLWNPMTDIIGLRLTIKNSVNLLFSIDLPVNATSYIAPIHLLTPNTLYELSLEAKVTDFSGNGLKTTRTISFTTREE